MLLWRDYYVLNSLSDEFRGLRKILEKMRIKGFEFCNEIRIIKKRCKLWLGNKEFVERFREMLPSVPACH